MVFSRLVLLTSALRAFVNGHFEGSFDTTFMKNIKNCEKISFFKLKKISIRSF